MPNPYIVGINPVAMRTNPKYSEAGGEAAIHPQPLLTSNAVGLSELFTRAASGMRRALNCGRVGA